MKNQFNFVAPFYSVLAKAVFGNTILEAQKQLISLLPKEGNLLIIGGGNGGILPYLQKHAPELRILFVEASSSMISLAKKKATSNPHIEFHHSDDFTFPSFAADYILAPFILDLFPTEQIAEIISKIENNSESLPTWYVCDFDAHKLQNTNAFQRLKITLSILFFRIFSSHTLHYLPDVFSVYDTLGYTASFSSNAEFDLISYKVFEK